MIDDASFVESFIKRRLPAITVFLASTEDGTLEVDLQNTPGKPLAVVRLLISQANAAALHRDPNLADRLIATLEQALDGPSDEAEAILDLRGQL